MNHLWFARLLPVGVFMLAGVSMLAGTHAVANSQTPQATPAHDEPAHAGASTADWTALPLLLPVRVGNPRMQAGVKLHHLQADALSVYSSIDVQNDGRSIPFRAHEQSMHAHFEALSPKIGAYYWLSARRVQNDEIQVASSVWQFANPSPAPRDMLLQPKQTLEIIPQPLPREHANYRESEKWRFLVRFNGKPLAGQTVTLDTEFGTHTRFVTNAAGLAVVQFPYDFTPEKATQTGHGGANAQFVLGVQHALEGKRYTTAFNYVYAPSPDRDHSMLAGLGFMMLGMVLATPLLRRVPTAGKKAQGENA